MQQTPQVHSLWKSLTCCLVLVALTIFSGCSEPKKKIVFLTNGDDPFWDTCRAGMDKAAEDLKIEEAGYTQSMDKGSEFSVEKQISKLEQYATQSDIAAVAISPVDANNPKLAAAMKRLRDKGVKLICVDSDMNRDQFRDSRFAYLGTDNIVGGQELGKAAKALLPEGGNYATFVGINTVKNAIDRNAGFAQGAGDKFKVLDELLADQADENKAQENVKTVLNKNNDINALVGIWSYNSHAIVRVLEERELLGKIKVVGFDATALALTDLQKGKVDVLVVQNPYQMGHLTIKLLKAIVEEDHKTIQEIYPAYDPKTGKFNGSNGDILDTELRVVVPNADSPIKSELFDKKTKFFTYEEFKAWLDERHLVSS